MIVRSEFRDLQPDAAAGDLAGDADISEDAVTGRASRVLALHEDARNEFDTVEETLASVRDRVDRVLAGDASVVPDEDEVAAPVAVPVTPVRTRSRGQAVALVLSLASLAITAGLVVSLNAATPLRSHAPVAVATEPDASRFASPQVAALAMPSREVETPGLGAGSGVSEDKDLATKDLGAMLYAARFAKAPASERLCLARAVYYEARGEEMDGQIAVAQVVLNRARSKKWPDTICGVVNQGVQRGEKCQFSFACYSNLSAPSGDVWEQAKLVAEQAVTGQAWLRELVEATYYHTTAVQPVWRTELDRIATIGTHIFYRDEAGLQAAAFDAGKYAAAAGAAGTAALSAKAIDTARAKVAAARALRDPAVKSGVTVSGKKAATSVQCR